MGFKCIDLDGEARGDLSLSKEYKDKLDEIKRKIGCKTLTETMEMLIDACCPRYCEEESDDKEH